MIKDLIKIYKLRRDRKLRKRMILILLADKRFYSSEYETLRLAEAFYYINKWCVRVETIAIGRLKCIERILSGFKNRKPATFF